MDENPYRSPNSPAGPAQPSPRRRSRLHWSLSVVLFGIGAATVSFGAGIAALPLQAGGRLVPVVGGMIALGGACVVWLALSPLR